MSTKHEIVWKEEIVGYMLDASIDNFFVYGKWIPVESALTKEFLAQLRANNLLTVKLRKVGVENTVLFTIDQPPDDGFIDMRISPRQS